MAALQRKTKIEYSTEVRVNIQPDSDDQTCYQVNKCREGVYNFRVLYKTITWNHTQSWTVSS